MINLFNMVMDALETWYSKLMDSSVAQPRMCQLPLPQNSLGLAHGAFAQWGVALGWGGALKRLSLYQVSVAVAAGVCGCGCTCTL